MTEVIHENPSRRRHLRLTAPIKVRYSGHDYDTENWSLGGFRLKDFSGNFKQDDQIDVTIGVPFQNCMISSDVKARVVMCNPESATAAFEFVDIDSRSRGILKFFSDGLISGEMASIDKIIRHIDIPVTPPPKISETEWRDQPLRVKLWRVGVMMFYLFLGFGIMTYVFFSAYSYFFRVNLETGVVTAPRETIVAPFAGTVSDVFIMDGSSFTKGTPLVRIEDPDKNRKIKQVEGELRKAENSLAVEKNNLKNLEQKITIYNNITKSRVSSLHQKIRGYELEEKLAQKEYQRQSGLVALKAASVSNMELAESSLSRIRRNLDIAREDLNVQLCTMDALEKGFFFSGRKIEESKSDIVNLISEAESIVQIKKQELKELRETASAETVKAPFNGRILKIARSAGNTVASGQPLMFIEKNGPIKILAFVTQEEAARISSRSPAVVFIPSLDRRFPAKIISIDRTKGFETPSDVDYRWRSSTDRSAVVTLEAVYSADVRNELIAGLPVTVNFPANSTNGVIRFISRYIFRQKAEDSRSSNEYRVVQK